MGEKNVCCASQKIIFRSVCNTIFRKGYNTEIMGKLWGQFQDDDMIGFHLLFSDVEVGRVRGKGEEENEAAAWLF